MVNVCSADVDHFRRLQAGAKVVRYQLSQNCGSHMSLKTADNILSVFEVIIITLSFAGWAALGFPEWETVAAFGVLCFVVFVFLQWVASRKI
jgi:hypothetical protein